jgi:hypothetical protein
MLLIYVDEVTERLIYTLDFIFKDRGIYFKITNDPMYFEQTDEVKLNYSTKSFENCVKISPATVLFDAAIFPYSISENHFENEFCFAFDTIVDPFSSIFYVLTRMEEYVNNKRDEHDRFSAKYSILHQHGILQKAMCDRWSEAIIKHIEQKLAISLSPWPIDVRIVPTFDIDNTYAFKWKQNWRLFLSTFKYWMKKDHDRLKRRSAVLKGIEKDPYDTFDLMIEISRRGFDVHLFWLLGDYTKYDKNISSMDQRHRKLILEMSQKLKVGLHPSYRSNEANFYLEREKSRMDGILGHEVKFSRQHFLKLSLPITYQNLIKKGFTDDFSMGFADEIGFRAGTARPFKFFDLSTNSATDYTIHPFAYMDGTIHEYKNWSIEESKVEIEKIYREVEKFGGDFICIWHNETIGNFSKWRGWTEVLDFTLNLSKKS